MKKTILYLATASIAFALSPAQKGPLPSHIAQFQPDSSEIGDPSWKARMKERKANAAESRTLSQDQFTLPVILGGFSDISGTFTKEQFQDHLFGNNPSGSMNEYYTEISGGQFNLTGTVFGWYAADQTKSYYVGSNNGSGTYPADTRGFVRSVVSNADGDINFSLFDNDGPDGVPNSGDDDGYVDAVMVVYPGAGPDWYPGNNNLWPKMWSLGSSNEFTTNDASANGGMVKVNSFAVCPERNGGGEGTNVMRTIGVYVHEFGHILGLPDLYDRTSASQSPDFKDSEGLGEWCLMASGSWRGKDLSGDTPTHMSAWCKYQMGWVTPIELKENAQNLSCSHFEKSGETYLIWEDQDAWSRYFLVENRQKSGFDAALPGEGLAIYHIDEYRRDGEFSWNGGPVNNDPDHKLVDLEEADGLHDLDNEVNRGDSTDLFPGKAGITSFTDATNPSAQDYAGANTGISITGITQNSDSSITFSITVKPTTGYVVSYDEGGITGWGYGYDTPQATTGGIKFTITEKGTVYGVDVGTRDANGLVSLDLYSGLNGNALGDLLTSSADTTLAEDGWHTILLSEPVLVEAGAELFLQQTINNLTYGLSYDPFMAVSGNSYWRSSNGNYSVMDGDINMRLRVTKFETPVGIESTVEKQKESLSFFPANGGVHLHISLTENVNVKAELFTLNGRRIAQLFHGVQTSGSHSLYLPTHSVAKGGYILKVQAGALNKSSVLVVK